MRIVQLQSGIVYRIDIMLFNGEFRVDQKEDDAVQNILCTKVLCVKKKSLYTIHTSVYVYVLLCIVPETK